MTRTATGSSEGGTLGLLAGGGHVPLLLARAAAAQGRPVFAVVLEGWGDPAEWAGTPHAVLRVGAGGPILEALRGAGVRDLVLAGRVNRPTLAMLRPDATGLRVLARLGRAWFAGDDGLLRAIARVLEEEGFRVLAADAVLDGLLPAAGLLGRTAPDAQARADIARGIVVLQAMAAADVGQAVVVQSGLVLGVEAIEGTDALLARAGALRREGPGGVLVKLAKRGQDRRLDLPTVGPETARGAIAAGLRGIAVEAGGTILVARDETIALADAAGLFLAAIRPDASPTEESSA